MSSEAELLKFEFDDTEKLLGLRLSPEYPPVVLAVKPDSAGQRKGVPVKGKIQSINGQSLLSESDAAEVGDLMAALKARPLCLVVAPPESDSGCAQASSATAAQPAASSSSAPAPAFAPPARVPAVSSAATGASASATPPKANVTEASGSAASPEENVTEANATEAPVSASPSPAKDTEVSASAVPSQGKGAEASASSAPPEAKAAGASASAVPPQDDASDGDSSASDVQHDDRTAADLALLKPAHPPQKPARSVAAAAAETSEDSGDDSGEGSDGQAGDVSADRFDRDMDLLHKQHQKTAGTSPKTSKPTSPSQQKDEITRKSIAQQQCEADEALARRLQMELDSEGGAALAGAEPAEEADEEEDEDEEEEEEEEEEGAGDQCVPEALLREDEELARRLQAEFDDEAAAHQLHLQEMQAARAAEKQKQMPPAPVKPKPAKLSPAAVTNPFGNLLSEPVITLHDDTTWAHRQRKFATQGASCMKVGRNGKAYKRTFWISEGCLRTDGKGTQQVPVTAFTGIFRGNRSEEFDKMNSSGFSLIRRSVKINILPQCCCVLTTPDRTFSLYFDTAFSCDEFVETLAWYTTRLTSTWA